MPSADVAGRADVWTDEVGDGGPWTNTAVVCVDLQNDFCHPDGAFARGGLRVPDRSSLVANVNRITAAARGAGARVVWVRMVYASADDVGLLAERGPGIANHALRAGTWGAELLDDLQVEDRDSEVTKTRFSAFYRTDLEESLRRSRTRHLVVTGVRTDFCVESTVRDAFFRDFRVTVVTDAVSGYSDRFQAYHDNSLQAMGTVFADLAATEDVLQWSAAPSGHAQTGAAGRVAG